MLKFRRPILLWLAMWGGAFLFAPAARANPENLELFLQHYHIADGSPLAEKSCGICHVSEENFAFNPYGKDVQKALKTQTDGKFTWRTLAFVEALDSNGDGKSNLQAIAAGMAPGEAVATKPGAAPEVEVVKRPLLPKHAYHPAIVHFPIAMVVAAFILDCFFLVTKKPIFHSVGTYNLWLGGVSSLVAVASGVAVMAFKQFPYKGVIVEHVLVALGASFMVWVSLATRNRPGKLWIAASFLAVTIAVVLIAYAGHFGGEFVYGE